MNKLIIKSAARYAFFLCLSVAVFFSTYNVLKLAKEMNKFRKEQEQQNPMSLASLETVPFGELTGLVKGVKRVEISHVLAPYNASIVEDGEGYLLFFRYDIPSHVVHALKIKTKLKAYIGCVKLDAQFNQVQPFFPIDTGSDFSEDPRVLKVNNELYLSYNDVTPNPQVYSRTIRIAPIDRETLTCKESVELDLNISPIEKNWIPFEYAAEGGKELLFSYSINPHKILKVAKNSISQMLFPNASALQKFSWEKKWGVLRGGTPAKLVDGQYLSFFHSAIKGEKGASCYVMGAYTFEAHPPFRVTAISPHPILFKGIYDTPICNTANHKVRCIFPSGFVVERVDGKELIHLSCGENDAGVKIVTLDKEALLKSLRKMPSL